jgi:hypothetical protein
MAVPGFHVRNSQGYFQVGRGNEGSVRNEAFREKQPPFTEFRILATRVTARSRFYVNQTSHDAGSINCHFMLARHNPKLGQSLMASGAKSMTEEGIEPPAFGKPLKLESDALPLRHPVKSNV